MRIVHVGFGPLGRRIAADLYLRGIGTVVAAVDTNPELRGKPLSTVVPESGSDLPIVENLDAIRDWSAIDAAVVTTVSDLSLCAETLRALLKRGLPVVSTCEELVYPWLRHAELAEDLDALAREHGGRLLGTGVNPGFLMDTLPVTATAVCRSVDRVRVWRVQDASTRREPFQRKIGAGLDREGFSQRAMDGSLRHVGLGESLFFIADRLGITLTSWNESMEQVRAERTLTCALGEIPAGHGAGVRQVATGFAGEREVITLDFLAAIGQENPHDRIVIDGDPGLDLTFAGGVHGDTATIAITLNAILSLVRANPGLHTMATVPIVSWRSAGK
ncbi:MAG: hypothetical protein KF866_03685 [Phycisphaeraceae bacterium]|nr:hypothetical protein [Phycisphaeraceae bacterium]MCW5753205.1 hypothetical protein [Phycisphaeraceae bacterium]